MKPQENSGSARTQTEQSHWAAHASEGQVWLGRPAGSSRVVWGLISCLQSVQLPWSKVEHPRPCIPLPSLLAQCRGSGELRRESGSFGLRPTTASPSGLPPPRHLPPAELPQVNPHRPPQWSSWVCPASVCWRASQIRPAAAPGTQPNAVRALPSLSLRYQNWTRPLKFAATATFCLNFAEFSKQKETLFLSVLCTDHLTIYVVFVAPAQQRGLKAETPCTSHGLSNT